MGVWQRGLRIGLKAQNGLGTKQNTFKCLLGLSLALFFFLISDVCLYMFFGSRLGRDREQKCTFESSVCRLLSLLSFLFQLDITHPFC